MTNITKEQVKDITVTGKFDISFSVRADEDSTEKKKGILRFVMNQTPLSEIIASSLKDKRINEQVKMRKNFESLPEDGIVEVPYEGGRQPIDIKQAVKNQLSSMSKEERLAYIRELEEAANM